ncbi:hypothetical protein B0O80DRAFT_452858 [Mortierella sp. GBAus27b]|nr:hypothetical protein B0O80DRAFT_452858 [Mortierella sp. GBAus27b]
MKSHKKSNSFEVVPIDDQQQRQQQHQQQEKQAHHVISAPEPEPLAPPAQSSWFSPRGRLVFLAAYLLINGVASLYFCLVQSSMHSVELCDSITSCLFYSSQGWPALGGQSKDLVVMSYISGSVSLLGGVLGIYGLLAAYKQSSSKVRFFARVWWIMIVIMIACTMLSLLFTVLHKDRFLNECVVLQGANAGLENCGSMYAAALVGSLIGCLIGLTMIWCYGEDVVRYSMDLDKIKEKTRRIENAS